MSTDKTKVNNESVKLFLEIAHLSVINVNLG